MKICRICETIDNLLCRLNDPENSEIVEMLTVLANVSYSNEDDLPKFLCQKCQKSLQFSTEFKRQCEMTDRKLRQSLTLLRAEEDTADIVDEFQSDSDMLEIEKFDTNAIKIECLEKELNTIDRDTKDIVDEFQSNSDMLKIENYDTVAIKIECLEKEFNNIGNDTEDSIHNGALEVVKKKELQVDLYKRTCIVCKMSFETISAMKSHKRVHMDPNLKCFYCAKRFRRNFKLECHVRTKHCSSEIRTFECFDCKKEFKTRQLFHRHYEISHSGISHVCHLCSKQFLTKGNLIRHFTIIHDGLKKYECIICNKHFGQKSVLDQHLASHSEEKPFRCQICDHRTKTSTALKCHNKKRHSINLVKTPRIREKNPEREPKSSYSRGPTKFTTCEYCGKQINILYYSKHVRTHTGENPYKCKLCPKIFTTNLGLVNHTFIHTGEYPYKCNVCDRKFRQLPHLLCHSLTHTGEKPHKCTFCSKTFAQRGNLRTHIRLHTGETPYHCTECSNRFIDLNALKRHKKKDHAE